MTPADAARADAALDWVCRIQDPHFVDWDAHIAWLEADPRHAAAFDAMTALIDGAAAELDAVPAAAVVAGPVPANDDRRTATAPARRRRWFGVGLGVAASVVALVAVPSLIAPGAIAYEIGTGAGERRLVTLADGSRIALNGETAVRLDRGDPRVATLLRGEAFFAVVHDPAHPFELRAGAATFRDVGTSFDATRDRDRTRVAVRDGAVLYDPGGAAVRLDGGKAIEVARDHAVVRSTDAAAIGGWRSGRLSYRDAPMSDVAADLSRSIGRPIRLDPRAAERRFSGVIMVDPDRPRLFRRVAAVTGVEIRRDGTGWRMALPSR